MSIREKFNELKEKRKQKHKEFEEKHPKLADALLKAQVGLFVVGSFAFVYFAGYTDGSNYMKNVHDSFDKAKKETDEAAQRKRELWLAEQRGTYLEHFNEGAYANNAAEFQIFAENVNLQPGEAFFLWDDNQFRGEGLPVEPMIDHQVYGISDPKYSEIDYNPWEMD